MQSLCASCRFSEPHNSKQSHFSDEDAHSCGSTVYQVWQAVLDKNHSFLKRFFFSCVAEVLLQLKGAEKASDKDIRRGMESAPFYSKKIF